MASIAGPSSARAFGLDCGQSLDNKQVAALAINLPAMVKR